MEVKQSQKVIRQKDSEIAGLKGMLQQKEMQVVAARSELVDARVQIQVIPLAYISNISRTPRLNMLQS